MAVVGGRCLFKMPTMTEVPGSTEPETVERTGSLRTEEMATAQGLQRSAFGFKILVFWESLRIYFSISYSHQTAGPSFL